MNRLLSLSLVALALSACSASQPERSARVDMMATGQITQHSLLSEPVTAAPVADESAAAAILSLPPDAGAPGHMSERQYANGWRQSVSLDSQKVAGGWNDLAIDVMTDEPGEKRTANIPIGKPSQDGVRREILARFPGTPMRIVGRPLQNGLGSFGLAIGAGAGGLRCAFAWQWVDDLRSSSSKGGKSFFRGKEMPASIRLRLCRKGVTADQLASWFEQLDISDMANVDRVAQAAGRGTGGRVIEHDAAGAGMTSEVVDASQSLERVISGGGRGPTVAQGAPRRHYARRRAAPRSQPEEETPQETPVAQSAPTESVGGRQYLGPVAGGGSGYAAAPPPAPSYAGGYGATRVNPSLPAEAYRGPSGGGATASGYGGQPAYLGASGR